MTISLPEGNPDASRCPGSTWWCGCGDDDVTKCFEPSNARLMSVGETFCENDIRSSNADGLDEKGDTDGPWAWPPAPLPVGGLGGGGPSVASWMLPKDVCPNSHDPPEVFIIVDVALGPSSMNLERDSM